MKPTKTPPTQPTPAQLKAEYKKLSKLIKPNGSVKSQVNPWRDAAKEFGYTVPGIKNFMQGNNKTKWKPSHWDIYNFIKKYLHTN